MDLASFKESLAKDEPPSGLTPDLEALWWDAKGDWEKAHQRVQAEAGAAGAWVHAYLHRKEGDLDNARYWYGRARRMPIRDAPLEAEWDEIARALLKG
jgi:hypothetical protein